MMQNKLKVLLICDFPSSFFSKILRKKIINYSIEITSPDILGVLVNLQNKSANFWKKKYDIIVIWSDINKILSNFNKAKNLEKYSKNKLNNELIKFSKLVIRLSKNGKYLIFNSWNLPTTEKGVGFNDLKFDFGLKNLLLQTNLNLSQLFKPSNNIILFDIDEIISEIGKDSYSYESYYLTKVFFTNLFFEHYSNRINIIIENLFGGVKKIIILDLDNTLWGGIIGDIGWEKINIGGHNSKGESFYDFQTYLKSLKQKGILLSICSKNNEKLALEAFKKNNGMVLSINDFANWRINWKNKSKNIKEILNEVNLPESAAVFIDDSEFEREEVRSKMKEITILNLPKDVRLYLKSLKEANLFHFSKITKEDKNRSKFFQIEKKRKETKTNYNSNTDWLKSLDIKMNVNPITKQNFDRSLQLYNKTNQMNLTTRRKNRDELNNEINKKNNLFLTFSISDSFGDYGLTGILSLNIIKNKAVLNDFILSCRVFGREIEKNMINYAIKICKQKKINSINAKYFKTQKNEICYNFFKNNFKLKSKNIFTINTDKKIKSNDIIKIYAK